MLADFGHPQYPEYISQQHLEILRALLVIPCIACLGVSIYQFSFATQLIFFTMWSNNFVIITTILTIYLGRDRSASPKLTIITRILCEISLVSQIFVVALYWPLLH